MPPLNTMFIGKANMPFINETFTCETIRAMHATMVRLYEAAELLRGLKTPTEVANCLNASPQTINNWERRGMSKAGMIQAQEKIGCSATWLQTGELPMTAKPVGPPTDGGERQNSTDAYNGSSGVRPTPLTYPADAMKFRRVYVVGKAQGGLPDRIWTDGDYPVGATDQYAEIASADPQAFLVPVVGTSMVPRFNPGEFALVEPGTEPELEDDVLVRLASGETMIKRLLSRRHGVRLGSYNDPAVLTYERDQISWMYYIAHPVPARKIKARL